MKTRLPWITTLLWAGLAISPIGQSFFQSAFLSGEQLSRAIGQPVYFTALAVAAVTIGLEALIRQVAWRRRGN